MVAQTVEHAEDYGPREGNPSRADDLWYDSKS